MEAHYYETLRGVQQRHWWYAARRDILASRLDALARRGLPEGVLYDLGCGVGANLPVLARHGEVVGIDGSAEAIASCHALGFSQARAGDISSLDELPSGSGKVVLLADVIEHLDDEAPCLRGAARLLAPGGKVLVTVPAFSFLWGPSDEIAHHRRRYTARSLAQALSPHFALDGISYFNTLLFAPICAGRLIERALDRPGDEAAAVPSRPVNALLTRIFSFEQHLLARTRLPFGVSLLAWGTAQR